MFQVNENLMMQLGSALKLPSHPLTVVQCKLDLKYVTYWVMDTANNNKMHQVKIKIT